MSSERVVELPDVAATHRLAAELAAALRPGDVLALVGDLGAGKTELVRGLVAALGAPADTPVCSPSFVLLNLYPGGRLPVAHYDACFMDGTDDLERAGLQDLLRQGWVVAVEWADRVAGALPAGTRWVTLESAGQDPGRRRARLGAAPPVVDAP
jgi:tRNA threonylcarbamoyladenosine biosynthesis protein TsaE